MAYATVNGEVTFTLNTTHSSEEEDGNQEAEASRC